jgi:hypothetical protein
MRFFIYFQGDARQSNKPVANNRAAGTMKLSKLSAITGYRPCGIKEQFVEQINEKAVSDPVFAIYRMRGA